MVAARIARELGIHRETVARYLKQAGRVAARRAMIQNQPNPPTARMRRNSSLRTWVDRIKNRPTPPTGRPLTQRTQSPGR